MIRITVPLRQTEHGHPHLLTKEQTVTNAPKSSLRDHLTTTTNDAKIELTEQELSAITGGRGKTSEKPREFIKITMSNIIVSDY